VHRHRFAAFANAAAISAASCNTNPFYKALEKIGIEKRELLVRRVTRARDAQKDAHEQFRETSASRMDPVLIKLHDQVLFLKHNLNAKVLGSLRGTADKLEIEVDALVKDMEASIAEATRFIDDMGEEEP